MVFSFVPIIDMVLTHKSKHCCKRRAYGVIGNASSQQNINFWKIHKENLDLMNMYCLFQCGIFPWPTSWKLLWHDGNQHLLNYDTWLVVHACMIRVHFLHLMSFPPITDVKFSSQNILFYFILFINRHPLSTRCMSKDGSEIKTRIKIPKEKKTTNQSPALANSSKTESGQRENLQENVNFLSSMCIFWKKGDHHSIGLLVKQHNMPETSLTKESTGNAPCVPTTSWEKLDKSMEMSLNKIKWFGQYGCSWSEVGGYNAIRSQLFNWTSTFNPKILFCVPFSLLIIFLQHQTLHALQMDFILYNDASDVEVMFDIYGNVQCAIMYCIRPVYWTIQFGIIYCIDP